MQSPKFQTILLNDYHLMHACERQCYSPHRSLFALTAFLTRTLLSSLFLFGLSFKQTWPNISAESGPGWHPLSKIQSAFVCFSLFSSCLEAKQYRVGKVLTQGETECQINNEDWPQKPAEEATEIRHGVLVVQPYEECSMCLQCCRFQSGLYGCLTSCIHLSNESKKADNI